MRILVIFPTLNSGIGCSALVKMRRYCAVASRFSIGGTWIASGRYLSVVVFRCKQRVKAAEGGLQCPC